MNGKTANEADGEKTNLLIGTKSRKVVESKDTSHPKGIRHMQESSYVHLRAYFF